MVASSAGGAVSPAGTGACVGWALGCAVGEILGEGLGEGLIRGPAGTTCCGMTLEFSGSNGRLVIKSARKVARAAAAIIDKPIINSGLPAGGRCLVPRCPPRRESWVPIPMRFLGRWLVVTSLYCLPFPHRP